MVYIIIKYLCILSDTGRHPVHDLTGKTSGDTDWLCKGHVTMFVCGM